MSLQNVVIITNRASIMGGAEKVACHTAQLVAKKGFNTYLFAACGPVAPELLDAGVKVICLNQDAISADGRNRICAAVQGLWNTKAGFELKSLLGKLDSRSTIVNLHSWTQTMSSSILQVLNDAGFPLIITAHDYFLACPNGGFYNYRSGKPCGLESCNSACRTINCDKRSLAQKKYRMLRFRIQSSILSKTKPNPGIIFLSDFSEKKLQESIPFSFKSYHIDNPIEADWASGVVNPAFEDRDIDCLFVGRMDPEKDCELFCRVVDAVGCRAVAVGDGSQKIELEEAFPSIEFVGRKSSEEVRRYYARSKCLLFPSSWYEVAPLTIREAQLSGALPVVLRGDTAGESFVRDGIDGFVVGHDDFDALVNSVRKLLERDANNKMRSVLASSDFSYHSESNYTERIISIYKEYLNVWNLM